EDQGAVVPRAKRSAGGGALRDLYEEVVTVHPPSTSGGLGRSLGRWLRSGTPAAPASACLPLLPSGSDGVHKLASRRTRPSTPRTEGCSGPPGPRAGIRPR